VGPWRSACLSGACWLLAGSVQAAGRAAPPAVAAASVADAQRAFDAGNYQKAIALCRRRLAASPADTPTLLVLGRAQAALGEFDSAYQTFGKVLARAPRDTDALYYVTILGGVLAQGEYDRLFAMAPDSPRAHQLLGDLYQAQDRPSDAEAEYKAGLERAPASLDLLITLGDLTRHQSRFEDALAYYGRAAQVAPGNYDVVYGLGVCRSYRQEYAQAIENFREALRRDPRSAPAHLALGHALLQSGQAAAAMPELQSAASLEPRMLQAHYLLGRALTTLGRREEAAAAFEKVKRLTENRSLAVRGSAGPGEDARPDAVARGAVGRL